MKLQSQILTGSDAFKANRTAHLQALDLVARAAAMAAATGTHWLLAACTLTGLGRLTIQ